MIFVCWCESDPFHEWELREQEFKDEEVEEQRCICSEESQMEDLRVLSIEFVVVGACLLKCLHCLVTHAVWCDLTGIWLLRQEK